MIFHGHEVVATTEELYGAIFQEHGAEFTVHSSFSDPTGTFQNGPGEEGRMETMWGFDGADIPLIGSRQTWPINPESPSDRVGMKCAYYIVVAKKERE